MNIVEIILWGLLIFLVYFLLSTVRIIVSNKGTSTKDFVEMEREQFVPFSSSKIKHSLLTLFEGRSRDERHLMNKLFEKMEAVLDLRYTALSTRLQTDFEVLDPAVPTSEFSYMDSTQIQEVEERFLRNWETAMAKANFKPLSQDLLEFALQEDYLNTLPIEIEWDRIDDKLLSRYASKNRTSKANASEHSNRIWVYVRGKGVDRTEDTFLLQKIDLLIVRFMTFMWYLIAQPLLLRFYPPAAAPNNPEPRGSKPQPVKEENIIRRYSLKTDLRKNGLASVNRTTTLQEPTFKEVIILYRLAKPKNQTKETIRQIVGEHTTIQKNDYGIFLKSFRDIPMADLETLFPEKKVLMKPSDVVKFSLAGIVGVISAIMQIEGDPSFYVTMVSLGGFLGLAVKFLYDYQAWMLYYESTLTHSLYDKSMDNHVGVILYLMEQLKYQEFKEAAIGYAFLLREGPLDEQSLDHLCEKYLMDLQATSAEKVDIDFECNDALEKLKNFGLVTESNGIYTAVPVRRAVEQLDTVWQHGAQDQTL